MVMIVGVENNCCKVRVSDGHEGADGSPLQHQPSSSNAEAVVVVTFGVRSDQWLSILVSLFD